MSRFEKEFKQGNIFQKKLLEQDIKDGKIASEKKK